MITAILWLVGTLLFARIMARTLIDTAGLAQHAKATRADLDAAVAFNKATTDALLHAGAARRSS